MDWLKGKSTGNHWFFPCKTTTLMWTLSKNGWTLWMKIGFEIKDPISVKFSTQIEHLELWYQTVILCPSPKGLWRAKVGSSKCATQRLVPAPLALVGLGARGPFCVCLPPFIPFRPFRTGWSQSKAVMANSPVLSYLRKSSLSSCSSFRMSFGGDEAQ